MAIDRDKIRLDIVIEDGYSGKTHQLSEVIDRPPEMEYARLRIHLDRMANSLIRSSRMFP